MVEDLVTVDNTPQRIGILAQRGVYEFHQNIQLLSDPDGVEKVVQILNLAEELPEVRETVELILNNYFQKPILLDANIKELSRGKEALEAIQEKIKDKIGDRIYYIQRVKEPLVDPEVIAQLAVRILKINCRFTPKTVLDN